ncbi:4-hydroxy-4-methyl-2-oxoglutarate aldolase [Paraburkholderia youngii]|uniref:Putative 4-hydroxy-4-methyl-2-oxoglutarate aldolase n=1 Tax=Paraburkholderia youngii TaxID=2782701 RepID=A0A7W8L981_9BURK|nr:4-carboxy-4-hydroxy-2-oxoadipate aldolase/oxaloacetate decarboxylase [Paraburkholderia youngii]MBB5402333.1 4-hydroxy-4-methyl-2-oxoglutarate aldolase [Paraburkholderia youngii]NVH70994.1 4-carboxy-4-hydroxy-2-oxoadipate aldolase/oxaloacetate decarboxylase [Paraburkholderia youngii]NVI08767.1 4-carboxy-4-hydroxy-2-oxoadipate aldolase/oxaloacetate decarboxylase [Paraburkholderia youngii]
MSATNNVKEHDSSTTIRTDFERVDAKVVEAARNVPAAALHEAGGKIGVLPTSIRPVAPGFRICGTAFTVHSPGGDNLWLHRAILAAKPGDVLVVYANGAYDHGYWGEVMTTAAKVRGLAGLVIDGCVRDADLLEQIGFPVFSRGLSIRGTGKDYGAIGWLNAPVLLGNTTVEPGDLIVGDRDGVVAVPRARASEVVAKAAQREIDEAAICKRIEAGETTMQIYGFH